MTNLDEYRLVKGCQKGDQAALTQLVKQYQGALYNAAFRILGDKEEAADATQSSFLKVIERITSFDTSKSLFSWIYRIAINDAIDRSRKLWRATGLEESWVEDEGPGIEEQLAEQETSQGLQRALMRIPTDARALIVMKHLNSVSYTDIAEILGVPEKTVKSRLYSARQHLKGVLERDPDFAHHWLAEREDEP